MATGRNDLLGELAADAALERTDFLVQATGQLQKFLDANAARISELGGLTLIDDDPDYLSVAPDLTFRSRSRFLDDETGQWQSETEIIESPAELIELYNPADIYQAFAEAAREAAGLPSEPTATGEMLETAGVAPDETVSLDDAYAEAADRWAEREALGAPVDENDAARRLYDLALNYQERSQRSEARLLADFEASASGFSEKVGDVIVVDDDDERLTLQGDGSFRAEVVPEDSEGEWRTLASPEDLVEYYDPTDVFGDLADAIAEGYPDVAPEVPTDGTAAAAGAAGAAGAEAEGESEESAEESADEDDEASSEHDGRNGHGT
jgi:hypothetical protein